MRRLVPWPKSRTFLLLVLLPQRDNLSTASNLPRAPARGRNGCFRGTILRGPKTRSMYLADHPRWLGHPVLAWRRPRVRRHDRRSVRSRNRRIENEDVQTKKANKDPEENTGGMGSHHDSIPFIGRINSTRVPCGRTTRRSPFQYRIPRVTQGNSGSGARPRHRTRPTRPPTADSVQGETAIVRREHKFRFHCLVFRSAKPAILLPRSPARSSTFNARTRQILSIIPRCSAQLSGLGVRRLVKLKAFDADLS